MKSEEKTVAGYIASLPEIRADVISEIRDLVNKNIKSGFEETMRWGMITWEIPLSIYPNTYNKQPLYYIGLAAQKNNYSLYLMSCYVSEKEGKEFEAAYKSSGKKMDIGKSCVRFKNVTDLPLPLIIKYIKRYSVKEFIAIHDSYRRK